MKRVLITDGTGLLVLCLENSANGIKGNIVHLRDHAQFELVRLSAQDWRSSKCLCPTE